MSKDIEFKNLGLLIIDDEQRFGVRQVEALGSGYRIALKDLEIRGAGNILGREQSGNINQVGLNLYCQILSEVIEETENCQTCPVVNAKRSTTGCYLKQLRK